MDFVRWVLSEIDRHSLGLQGAGSLVASLAAFIAIVVTLRSSNKQLKATIKAAEHQLTTNVQIAERQHSHDFEKERRRRKQDCLERVIEDLDEIQSVIDELTALSLTAGEMAEEPNPEIRRELAAQVNSALAKTTAAQIKFNRSQSKLIVFGFAECSAAVDEFYRITTKYNVVLDAARKAKGSKDYLPVREELLLSGNKLRAAVAEAFKTL
jgi:hypothetical protein